MPENDNKERWKVAEMNYRGMQQEFIEARTELLGSRDAFAKSYKEFYGDLKKCTDLLQKMRDELPNMVKF